MSTTDVFRIYTRFGNFFSVKYTDGVLYRFETNPIEKIGSGKTIFFQGEFYSYENALGGQEITPSLQILKSMITRQFALKLRNKGYRFKGNYRPYRVENQIEHPHNDIFSVYDGFEFRTVLIDEQMLLCIDPHTILKFNCSIEDLINFGIKERELSDFSVSYEAEEEWRRVGYLLKTYEQEVGKCRIKDYADFTEVAIRANAVIPEARPELIRQLLSKLNRDFDVVAFQRRLSFLDSKTASRDRLLKTLEIVRKLLEDVFPLTFGEFEVNLGAEPVVVRL